MTSKIIMLTRKEYDLIAKNRGIKEPKKISTEEILNTLYRYDIKHEAKIDCRKLNKTNLKNLLKNKIFQEMNYVNLKSYKINQ